MLIAATKVFDHFYNRLFYNRLLRVYSASSATWPRKPHFYMENLAEEAVTLK